MLKVVHTAFMLSAVAGTCFLTTVPVLASVTEHFVGHAQFEAEHGHGSVTADPEVFVADENAPQATGALGIVHVAGFRAALLGDNQAMPIYNAQGTGLSLSLGRWFGASGNAEFLANNDGDGPRVKFAFTDLVPFGVYSLFLSRSTPDGTLITPFAENTTALTASIDGFLELTAVCMSPLETGDDILLIYHSDGTAHGQGRGDLGLTAHDQLILPVVLAAQRAPADSTAVPMPEDGPTSPPVQEQPVSEASPPSDQAQGQNTSDVYTPSARATPSTQPHPTESVTGDGEPTF